MDKKNYFKRIMSICIIGVTIFSVLFYWSREPKAEMSIQKLAYGKSRSNYTVYLKENDEYVPYLVVCADYKGDVLLLRKELLPDMMAYKEHSEFWRSYDYGSYYEESSIDKYLNTQFYDSLSELTRYAITECEVEVTDKECYEEMNFGTHNIMRNVFLLSSVELGIKGHDGYTTAKEGDALKYFKNKDVVDKGAYQANGKKLPYWTRTPDLSYSSTVFVVGVEVIGSTPAHVALGIRPAFCMNRDTVVKRQDNIIEGESVYVIE